MNLSATFGIHTPAAPDPAKFSASAKGFNKYTGLPGASFDSYKTVFITPTVVGIEVEVENILKEVSVPFFWIQDADGSLRNSGKEFKTIPLLPEQAFEALDILWKVLHKASGNKPDFSWRSSIHFHVNALDLDSEEFRRWVMLSLLFENVFFLLAGESREQSNFCVPLCRSSLTGSLNKYLLGQSNEKKLFAVWNASGGDSNNGAYKYSAINFSRLGDLGTVEFRHLGGTDDLKIIYLSLAVALKLYLTEVSIGKSTLIDKINALNTEKSYAMFVKTILGKELVAQLEKVAKVNYQDLLQGSVTKVKEMISKAPVFADCSVDSSLIAYATQVKKKQDFLDKGGKPGKK
jgi:hypothetical protein